MQHPHRQEPRRIRGGTLERPGGRYSELDPIPPEVETEEPRPGATEEREHQSPCRRLAAAVLEDAVEALTGPDPRASSEAARWMRSPSRAWPFAFEVVCETLDLDPKRIRKAALG